MKILYLCHRIPYPPNKGDKIRSFNEIKYLSRRHEIHLACLADDPGDLKYETDLKKYCKTTNVILINQKLAKLKSVSHLFSRMPLSIPYFYSKDLQKTIDFLLSTNTFDSIFCFSSPMAEYVFRSKLLDSGFWKLVKRSNQQPATSNRQPATSIRRRATKLIMDFVDVDSDKWAQYARYTYPPKSWIYKLESQRLSVYERKVAEAFDHSVFVTQAEVDVFKAANPHIQNVTAISNGVDLDYFSPNYLPSSGSRVQQPATSNQYPATSNEQPATSVLEPEASIQGPATSNQQPETSNQQPVIVFTGAMDYHANVDGVLWFTKEILPLIKKEMPETLFYIVGGRPTKEVRSLSARDGVIVTGYVPDTREYLKKASIVVAPLRIARGIQNKILEAMAMGIPVVSTPEAFEGIEPSLKSHLLTEREPKAFAESVIKLIRDKELRKNLSNNSRLAMETHYGWTKNMGKFDVII